jgi:hypothetical protein
MENSNNLKRIILATTLICTPLIPNQAYSLNARHIETQYQTVSNKPSDSSLVGGVCTAIYLAAFGWMGMRAIRQSHKQQLEEH